LIPQIYQIYKIGEILKIGIIGAMREEITPILEIVKSYKEVTYGKNSYFLAEFNGIELVIAYSKIGKVFSTLTASTMIQEFGAEKILFSGVAGGLNPNLKIGDLIYATKLAQHDLDISSFGHPYGFVPEGSVFIETSPELNQIADEVAKDKNIKLGKGVIATGDQFVADSERKKWIVDTFSADAVEMEGSSVAVVCDSLNIPFFILRAISDSADSSADVDFDTFLDKSAKISASFIMDMVLKIK
jgi:adenosylhomocysteine/aminodeoxyfutalosine nucleosidase